MSDIKNGNWKDLKPYLQSILTKGGYKFFGSKVNETLYIDKHFIKYIRESEDYIFLDFGTWEERQIEIDEYFNFEIKEKI